MNAHSTRRTFLAGLGAVAAVTTLPSFAAPGRTSNIRFGYTAMTWGNEERQAIDDICRGWLSRHSVSCQCRHRFQTRRVERAFGPAQADLCGSFQRRCFA